jgi:hypothetical protein
VESGKASSEIVHLFILHEEVDGVEVRSARFSVQKAAERIDFEHEEDLEQTQIVLFVTAGLEFPREKI